MMWIKLTIGSGIRNTVMHGFSECIYTPLPPTLWSDIHQGQQTTLVPNWKGNRQIEKKCKHILDKCLDIPIRYAITTNP